ncbi:putative glutathione-specific gamma-glutamylcyclotransferase 2 [Leptinotarsa decemlineata]|uniref:putative glutathione-specific gamma-glutamylcyclotransferase 2 n=1 Tax=Leptinotarsa decemlineata TaxID=7539 RepID=UPI000C254847|nr:putative glutathione-specific gamma-glutamylcyclotransferase 2 [Leptinotarsa decemlineata]
MWIFGYGSLIWKVDFPFEEKILGFVKGFDRRFYQYSTDHRGTPENPGRTVTIIPAKEDSRVYGIAYKIRDSDIEDVVSHLDFREKDGYERKSVMFYPISSDQKPFEITIYIANQDNINYAGYADLKDIAKQVVKSVGPSGPNIDYVFNLADAMRTLFPSVKDNHLFELERNVSALLNESSIRKST